MCVYGVCPLSKDWPWYSSKLYLLCFTEERKLWEWVVNYDRAFILGWNINLILLSFSVSTSVCMGNLSTERHQETCSSRLSPFLPPPRNYFVYCTVLSFSNHLPREVLRLAELCPCLPGGGSSVLSQDIFHIRSDCSQSNQCAYMCVFACVHVCVLHLHSFFEVALSEDRKQVSENEEGES